MFYFFVSHFHFSLDFREKFDRCMIGTTRGDVAIGFTILRSQILTIYRLILVSLLWTPTHQERDKDLDDPPKPF